MFSARAIGFYNMGRNSEGTDPVIFQKHLEPYSKNWAEAYGIILSTPNIRPIWSSPKDAHSGVIQDLVFSPDGKILATARSDKTIKLWDMTSGILLKTLLGHTGKVLSLSFSQDGKLLASGSDDQTVKIWNVVTGKTEKSFQKKIRRIKFGKQTFRSVNHVRFSATGSKLASASNTKTISIWDVKSGKLLDDIEMPYKVEAVEFSRDGRKMVLQFDTNRMNSDEIKIFGISPPTKKIIDVSRKEIRFLEISPDNKKLLTGGWDGHVILSDMVSGKMLLSCPLPFQLLDKSPKCGAFSRNGEIFATAHMGFIFLWDAESGNLKASINTNNDSIMSLAFSPDNNTIAYAGSEGKVNIWDISSIRYNVIKNESDGFDGKFLALESANGKIRIWNKPRQSFANFIKQGLPYTSKGLLSIPGKNALVITNNSVHIYDADSGSYLFDLPVGKKLKDIREITPRLILRNEAFGLKISPDGKFLVSWNQKENNAPITINNYKTEELIRTIKNELQICSVAFHPKSKIIAVGCSPGKIKFWDINTGENVLSIKTDEEFVVSVAFSPDGKQLAAGGIGKNNVTLWDTKTGQLLTSFQGHTKPIMCVAFSPNGHLLASGSNDQTIRLWDLTKRAELAVLRGHKKTIERIAFHPSNNILASISSHNGDGEADETRFWNLDTPDLASYLKVGHFEGLDFKLNEINPKDQIWNEMFSSWGRQQKSNSKK